MGLTENQLMLAAAVAMGGFTSVILIIGGFIYILRKPPTAVLNAEALGVIFIVCGMVLFTAVAVVARTFS